MPTRLSLLLSLTSLVALAGCLRAAPTSVQADLHLRGRADCPTGLYRIEVDYVSDAEPADEDLVSLLLAGEAATSEAEPDGTLGGCFAVEAGVSWPWELVAHHPVDGALWVVGGVWDAPRSLRGSFREDWGGTSSSRGSR